jgi:hypothetical protein
MMRALVALFTVMALAPFMREAHASACSTDAYMHNGSLMEVQLCDGGAITISYTRPRPGMAKAGARPGSLLFDGFEGPGGAINGQSRLFSARCGVVTYAVSGSRQGNTIVLNGTAPVRGGAGCGVTRYRQDNLVFTLAGPGAGGPQTVPPQCPPGFYLSRGQCIRAGAGAGPSVPPPPPPSVGGDWYAIAGSFGSPGQARARVGQLGGAGWYIMNTNQCPNFRNGYWIATAGPFSKGQAQRYAGAASRYSAYVKTCH